MDLTSFVDLFIGTQGTAPGTAFNGGNVFPGKCPCNRREKHVPFPISTIGSKESKI